MFFLSYQTGWEHITIFYDSKNGGKECSGITTIFPTRKQGCWTLSTFHKSEVLVMKWIIHKV